MDATVAGYRDHLIKAGINPAVWAEVLALIQQLISGCGPVAAREYVLKRPALARRRFFHEALLTTGSWSEATEWANAAMAIGAESAQADYDKLATMNLDPVFAAL